jgi:hypothetical protein
VRKRSRQTGKHRLRLAAEQVGEGRRDAAIGDVQHERADLLLEQLHRQMRQRARPSRAVVDPSRVLAHVVDELRKGLDRQRAVDDQHVRRGPDHADRREVLDRVVADIARRRCRAVRCDIALHQRIAVRCGPRGRLAGDHPAATALVLDHELLPDQPAPSLGDDARDHVVAAAGRNRNDVADRLGGIGLGARRPGQQQRR